jgi:hypothetical protein
MTVMLRTLGIPSRLVNGFLPGEYNDVAEDWIVRASDAHSWVEVYFPGFGWIPFDPTPPADPAVRGWFGRLALYYDWFQLMWSEWIINYDFSHQMSLAQNVQRASVQWSEKLRRKMTSAQREAIDWMKGLSADWILRNPWVWTLLCAGAGGLLYLVRGRRLREWLAAEWGIHFRPREKLTPRMATLLYQNLLRALARRGMKKPPGQTPQEFAATLPDGELRVPVTQLTSLYHAARFGEHPTEAERMTELLNTIKAILREKHRK